MRITSIDIQAKNKDRVNVSVDGKYRFSLDVFQVGDLGLRVGGDYTDQELASLEQESLFGKLYGRALEYSLMRPHSIREVKEYLFRKTRTSRAKTGELKPGIPVEITDRVFERLLEKGYVNDETFARFWVENRKNRTGVSMHRLTQELRQKGVELDTINTAIGFSDRNDNDELRKVMEKKRPKYQDDKKLIAYLMRYGFRYDDIMLELGDKD